MAARRRLAEFSLFVFLWPQFAPPLAWAEEGARRPDMVELSTVLGVDGRPAPSRPSNVDGWNARRTPNGIPCTNLRSSRRGRRRVSRGGGFRATATHAERAALQAAGP